MKNRTRQILIDDFKITSFVYAVVYFIKTFVIWEFTNPFQWVIDLPKYDSCARASILTGIIIFKIISLSISSELNKEDKKKEN